MKAILIDVVNKEVREVEVVNNDGSNLDSIYGHIGCELIDVVGIDQKNDVYVDDEGLLNLTPNSMFFELKGFPNPLAGNGLVMGIDRETGESVDTTLTVDDVKKRIRFLSYYDVAVGNLN